MRSGWQLAVSSSRCHQVFVLQVFTRYQKIHRVPENELIIPIVEAVLKLIEVQIQMLRGHLVKRADERTLEQAPRALDRVRVVVVAPPFVGRVAAGHSCVR